MRNARWLRERWLVAAVAAALVGCDSSGPAPALSPGVNLTVSGPTAPLAQGGTATATVSITRTGGFRGAVQVTAEGVPAGVTVAPLTIGADATSGTLTLSAAPSATPATATVTVRANATGITERTASFGLSVAEVPGFTMSVAPTSLSLAQGAAGTATVNIARSGGFTGAVTLTATGAPAGLTVTIDPASATAGTATVHVAAGPTAAPGAHTITLRGAAAPLPERTATLTVTVTAEPSMAIQATPQELTIGQGRSGGVTVTVTRGGGFVAPVALTVENLPTGVTASGTTIAADATTGQITFNVAGTAAAATSNVTIRAAGPGVADQTANVALTVADPGGFALSVSPAAATMPPGGTATATVTVARVGAFAAAVSLSATDVPAGFTVSFVPPVVSGAEATVSITAPAAAAAGTYPITLRGTAPGADEQSATFTVTITTAPAISIAANPTAVEVSRGASVDLAVNLTRGGGFAGPVTLAPENLPAGISMEGATIPAGATSTSLTLSASDAALLITSHVTIRASGAGVPDATAGVDVTVTQPATYTMSVSPGTVTVAAGGTTTATIALARTGGFTGPVALAAVGVPAGVTVTFDPANVTANQAAVTVAATAGAVAGTYPVTLRGTAPDLPDRTVTLNVQVAAGPSGGNVTWQFCSGSGLPLWVAAQNGSGAWTRVTSAAGSAYTFQIDTRGGVAWVVDNGGVFELYVDYGTRAELQSRGSVRCDGLASSTRTVNGSIIGMGPTDVLAHIAMGGGSTQVVAASGTSFQLTNVRTGTVDLIGTRLGDGPQGLATNRLFIQRGLNPPNGGSVIVDFTGPNSFAPATGVMTLNNLGGDHASVVSTYFTGNGTSGILGFDAERSGATTRNFVGVPASRQEAGDFHRITVDAVQPGVSEPTHQRSVRHVFRTLADRVFTFGPVMSAAQASVVGTQPYARLRLSHTVQAEYNSYFTANFTQDTRDATIQMTAGYLGGSSLVLEVPNFSAVAGWNNDWGLRPGAETVWTLSVEGWSATGATPQNPLVDNTVIRSALRWGVVTP